MKPLPSMATSFLLPVNWKSPEAKLVEAAAWGMLKNWGPLGEFRLLAGRSPACTAATESSCFLKPGTELEARFSEMTSCQRLLALSAAAAWYKLTFIRGNAKHRVCHGAKRLIYNGLRTERLSEGANSAVGGGRKLPGQQNRQYCGLL